MKRDRRSWSDRVIVRGSVALLAALALMPASARAQEARVIQAQSNQPVYTSDLLVHQLEINDPVAFALRHEKQLKISKPQRDTLRQFERALRQQRSPILREAEQQLNRPMPARSQQFDPLALPAPVREGYVAMMEATLGYGPRVNALLDSTQLAALAELRAAWVPPQPKAGARKAAFTIDQVSPPGGRPPM
jgi:hypothetical protein